MKLTSIRRFEGALLGLATGDALGACTKDMLPSGIRGRFGGELADFPDKKYCKITDNGKYNYTWDTRIALDIARSLIESKKLSRKDLASRLVHWSLSLQKDPPLPITYMRAARLARNNYEDSISTGQPSLCSTGAARSVPATLFFNGLTQKSINAAITITNMTHSTQEAHASSVAISLFINFLLQEINPDNSFDSMCKIMEKTFPDFCANILSPVRGFCELDHEAAFNCIGLKNDLIQIVPTAFYCFLKHRNDFRDAVCCAVNRGGNANSTASITGAMAGAYLGSDSIPGLWKSELFNSSEIYTIAEKLHNLGNESSD